jgi:hypothetical protein
VDITLLLSEGARADTDEDGKERVTEKTGELIREQVGAGIERAEVEEGRHKKNGNR